MLADDSADAIASIHGIEHFYAWEIQDILTEWKRILKPGGKLILELPCLDKMLFHMLHCVTNKLPLDPYMGLLALYGEQFQKDPAMAHHWAWTKEQLASILKFVGFREITDCEPRYHFAFRDMRWECIK